MLAALAAIGPFAIDTYLPAFHAIAADLHCDMLSVQQSLTAYLLPFAFMALWHGSLSDALGRRPVILVSLAGFVLASCLCAAARHIEILWLGRALQGIFSGAGMIVGRAVGRDLFDGPAAQRLMARVSILFGLAPAVAPIVGGWLYAALGWREVFLFLALYGVFLMVAVAYALPETLSPTARRPLSPHDLWSGYREVFGARGFWRYSGALAANFSAFFVYVLAAPMFLMQHLGVSAQGFAVMFVPTVIGMMTGSWISGRLAGRVAPAKSAAIGCVIMTIASLANLSICIVLPPGLPWSILPLPLYTLGMGMSMPALSLLALDMFPARRGMVSSCQSVIQSVGNALVAGVVAPFAWGSTLGLATAQALLLALGLGAFGLLRVRAAASQ
ncbi:MAG: multidrug effflux MFS transporter [Rhodocyclaceae bacterium]|nr:multidrug effflux MFS transporter [Rhodocyclaceae bacterium]MBX3669523.1 multidrug effflux MFS transporter [Rhodocyclaceae bacterium]